MAGRSIAPCRPSADRPQLTVPRPRRRLGVMEHDHRRTPAQYVRGLRWGLYSRWAEHTSYITFSRLRHPLGVVTDETELVIEGYMRSANTFSTVAFQTSQPN